MSCEKTVGAASAAIVEEGIALTIGRSNLTWLVRCPKFWAGCTWLISLSVAVIVLVLADFGGPSWIFIPCCLWLCSVGLPTTLSLLGLVALWGILPWLANAPLPVFAVAVGIVSLAVQTMAFLVVIQFLSRQRIGR